MPLSDINIKNAKPKESPYKLPDGNGLYVLVHTGGGKYFRLNYRYDGKHRTLALGTYPEVSLKLARDKAFAAKQQIADGIDPAAHKQATKSARTESLTNSLDVIAAEWLRTKCNDHSDRPKRQLGYILPWLGRKAMDNIKPKDLLACLRRVESTGTVYSAKKALQMYGQVWRYAVATGRAETDITQSLKGALETTKGKHFAAITEPAKVGELMRAIDGFQGSFAVHSALKLAPLVFQRPGELRAARWQDIDLDAQEWRYFVTKTGIQHIVPLSKQATGILLELRPLTGHGHWVFPSERNPMNTEAGRCMSENTLNAALRRIGYSKEEMSAHGFRAMARTVLDEVLGFRPDYIEHQLAHAVRDPLGRSYNRTSHLPERKIMMQAWADYLDQLKTGGNVVPIKPHREAG